MSNTKDEIIKEVRFFFRNITWKKSLTFLFFILLATIFWVMQIYRQKFEATISIPIKYIHIPDSIIFEDELPTAINVRIKDNGAALFNYYFNKRKDSIEIDIRERINLSTNKAIEGISLEQLIRSKTLFSSQIISYSPARISYRYAVLAKRRLPIIYAGYINLPTGYIIDGDISIQPDSVWVYGAKEHIDTLKYIHTMSDTIGGIVSDSTLSISIMPTKELNFVPNSLKLSVPVDKYTEKVVNVAVVCVNLPENVHVKFFPSSVKVPFSVGLKRFKDISANDFVIKVDYNDIKNLKESSIPIRIIDSPNYIRTKEPIPAEVEFVIEQE